MAARGLGAGLALLALAAASGPARAEAPAAPVIPLELNKLEPLPAPGSGCRVYLMVSNPDPAPIADLRLDLIVFGTDGVIARRVAVNLAPLPARKTAVRLFDLAGQACESVGRLLLNDVLACRLGGPEAPPGCLDRLQLSSRARAPFAK